MRNREIALAPLDEKIQLEYPIAANDEVEKRRRILAISAGMDEISAEEKQKSISFAEAMVAIEGVPISEEVKRGLSEWKDGKLNFAALLEQTLVRYGFLS